MGEEILGQQLFQVVGGLACTYCRRAASVIDWTVAVNSPTLNRRGAQADGSTDIQDGSGARLVDIHPTDSGLSQTRRPRQFIQNGIESAGPRTSLPSWAPLADIPSHPKPSALSEHW